MDSSSDISDNLSDVSDFEFQFISEHSYQSNGRVVLDGVTHYDQNLTPAHKYLGDGLCETTGRTVFEENITHTLPVIFLRLNLMPGQTLPIIARTIDVKLLLKYALSTNRAFGVSYKLNKKGKQTFGTIAEVYEQSIDIENSQSFQVKAMGHQRYKILNITPFPESNGQSIALAQIKIIPDTTLTRPYRQLCLHPKNRNLRHNDACRKKDMWQTLWPDWVYTQFDVNHLASILTKKIKILYKDVKVLDDPCLLSFQVLRLGIFQPKQVSFLLGIESTNLRLQYEISYWNDNQAMQKFICNGDDCNAVICDMSSVFPMSPEGPQGTYCNSWGQIHDMITVTDLANNLSVIVIGRASTECCWFPGYKWLIILCPCCQSHLGWQYEASENSSLVPRIFYGLSMRAIKPFFEWNNTASPEELNQWL
ncbi:protein cereblon isoform X2 [Sipha flava]|uniref:Protein cereblon n=1 Tax=Sipha flava TaxID=143950 RepID=A0A8B8FNL0_9HEMI|nr:protein cereblon isoform X2 [Sipha flava]